MPSVVESSNDLSVITVAIISVVYYSKCVILYTHRVDIERWKSCAITAGHIALYAVAT